MATLGYETAWFGVANTIAEADGVRELEMYGVSCVNNTINPTVIAIVG